MNNKVFSMELVKIAKLLCANTDAEFDAVAPVVVYFFTDLKYKKEARKGLKQLAKMFPQKYGSYTLEDLEKERSVRYDLASRYNELFEEIAKHEAPHLKPFEDKYGSYGLQYSDGEQFFSGDDSGFYPFYLDSTALKKRLNE